MTGCWIITFVDDGGILGGGTLARTNPTICAPPIPGGVDGAGPVGHGSIGTSGRCRAGRSGPHWSVSCALRVRERAVGPARFARTSPLHCAIASICRRHVIRIQAVVSLLV
jgi:hypothetical protein